MKTKILKYNYLKFVLSYIPTSGLAWGLKGKQLAFIEWKTSKLFSVNILICRLHYILLSNINLAVANKILRYCEMLFGVNSHSSQRVIYNYYTAMTFHLCYHRTKISTCSPEDEPSPNKEAEFNRLIVGEWKLMIPEETSTWWFSDLFCSTILRKSLKS